MCAAAWYSAGFFTGAYGKDAQDGYVGPAALTAAKTWAIAAPLGLVFRSVLKGYAAPVPFIIVAMTVTGFLTIGWRSGLAALTKPFVRFPTSILPLLLVFIHGVLVGLHTAAHVCIELLSLIHI